MGRAVPPAARRAADAHRRGRTAQAHHLHRAPRHPQLSAGAHRGTCSAARTAVVTIHGGVNRDDRRKIQEAFRYDPTVLVLVATDAAGEGVNLQNANLMVNYDLPWNPNRLEQRFGRIHRIGQTEVCHLWNLVAERDPRGRCLPAPVRQAGGGARGAGRPGLRHPGRGLRQRLAQGSADRRHPPRRAPRGPGQAHPDHRAAPSTPSTCAPSCAATRWSSSTWTWPTSTP